LWRWPIASCGLQRPPSTATADRAAASSILERNPFVSVTYWAPNHDTSTAECPAVWSFDDDTRRDVWELFKQAPAPVGYDPGIVPAWKDGPTSPAFAALRLDPWRLRVFPGTALVGGAGEILNWSAGRE
jgi:hypothetical protein